MTNDELQDFWKGRSESMIRAEGDSREALGELLDEDARDVLCNVGFPVDIDWAYSFMKVRVDDEGRVIFGEDYDVPLAVDRQGRVLALEEGEPRYVNASIRQFATMLTLYQSYREQVVNLNEQAAQGLIDKISKKMALADPTIVEDEESYWVLIIGQMKDSLL